ncbi:hypothetical protein [Curvivirga sp.]|uniref:hypothetical protein n=1 Tax=Curvivirga sp. TaxID=2856848 RepID=UPI003B59F909
MGEDTKNYRDHLKERLAAEIRKQARFADVMVYSVYDLNMPEEGPVVFDQYERKQLINPDDIPIDMDFEGIGVWYICFRQGDTFSVRHILLKRTHGRFTHQQTGVFEGFWEDWPRYVAEDKWVKSAMLHN